MANTSSRYNIDNIDLDEPSIELQPSHFQAGSIIDATTFQQVLTQVMNQETHQEEQQQLDHDLNEGTDDDDDDMITNTNLFNEIQFDQQLERDLQHLSQVIQINQPFSDNIAGDIVDQLGIVTRTTTDDHSNLYYGHLNRQELAQQFHFNLEPTPSQINDRFNAKSFAITSWTEVSKDLVMDYIKNDFDIDNIQYICVCEEISELNHRRHLHIQIIFKTKIHRRIPFLDQITQTHCNYQVTRNNKAWNSYIIKGGNYSEYGCFEPIQEEQQFTTDDSNAPRSHRTITVREQIGQRQQQNKEMARQAFILAETNVHQAMDYIRQMMPDKFLAHSTWYLATFNYINGRKQQQLREPG
ncbi:unnamed protein product [Adineta steineri]|uniref:Replication-associated protein n=1 Tax=Adineta steineri TaxID=433720 RepID=A0A819TC53_9BILA|nr:unnamed protein product [Adineta steineri]CAF4070490.1 unnamed protein product [Adineta steineri]